MTPQSVTYTANGVCATFAYPFPAFEPHDLEVVLADVVQVSGFTVTGLGSNAGGAVIFSEAPSNGVSVILRRTGRVQVSGSDAPGFLETKLVAGAHVSVTKTSDAGGEHLVIAAAADPDAYLAKNQNLADLSDTGLARDNLGLGTAATKDVGASAGQVVQLDASARLPAVDGSQLASIRARFQEFATVASASSVNLDSAGSSTVRITGTTTITTITLASGSVAFVEFAGALTLTNSATLILPGGANITTVAGDTCVFVGEGSGVVRCYGYQKANGQAIVAPANPVLTLVSSTHMSGLNTWSYTGFQDGYDYIIRFQRMRYTNNSGGINSGLQYHNGTGWVTSSGYKCVDDQFHQYVSPINAQDSGASNSWVDIFTPSDNAESNTEFHLFDPYASNYTGRFPHIAFSRSSVGASGPYYYRAIGIAAHSNGAGTRIYGLRIVNAGGTDTYDAGSYINVYKLARA